MALGAGRADASSAVEEREQVRERGDFCEIFHNHPDNKTIGAAASSTVADMAFPLNLTS